MQKLAKNSLRSSRQLSSAMVMLGLMVFGSPAASAEEISFTQDVKPIFDTKCVSCHSCYDSPAQLDMRSTAGIERGAMKLFSYSARNNSVPPTFVWNSKNTLEDWRKLGFFSVTEDGQDSIMGKLLRLGHDNPVEPNERIASYIELDPFKRKYTFPNSYEIDAYLKQKPLEGMPLAVSGLSDSEYTTIMKWLEQGANFDNKPAQPSATDLSMMAKWEGFLNAEDSRTQLMARYIFEHLFLVTFLFEDKEDANFYTLVRSSTPSGEPVVPVTQHLANGPVAEGKFFYRFKILDQTRCAKNTRLQMVLTDKKMNRWKDIFDEQEWSVSSLPGYSEQERYDPMGIFSPIPAKVRYKWLLDNTWQIQASIVHGPQCHSNLAVSSVQDQSWLVWEDPETSLYVNDADYRDAVDPMLSFYINTSHMQDAIATRNEYILRRREYIKERMKREGEAGLKSRIEEIWSGEDEDDVSIITVYRNETAAYQMDGNVAAGNYPKTIWVYDLPIFEHAYYVAAVTYDPFANSDNWLRMREHFGLSRIESEMNLLRFIPADKREPTFLSWYPGPLSAERLRKEMPIFSPEDFVPTAIEYKTDNPLREFYDKMLAHLGERITSDDPINREGAKVPTEPVPAAMRRIVDAARDAGPSWKRFKALMPEMSFLRIDREGQEPIVYTMHRDKWYDTKAFISTELQNEDPSKGSVSILEGVQGLYPRFMFKIPEAEVDEFADVLIAAESEEDMRKLVERWGIRRSSPELWDYLATMKDYVYRRDPSRAGTFDVSRYVNY